MSTNQPSLPKPKLRWHQFSLRTLLIFVMLFACACSWFAVKMQQAQRQKKAVEVFRNKRATVRYGYESKTTNWQFVNGEVVEEEPIPPGPAWLRSVIGDDIFRNVIGVDFSGWRRPSQIIIKNTAVNVTDADLDQLQTLKQLEWLNLNGTSIADKGLENIKSMPRLRHLYLENTQITDDGLECLKDLNQLERLDLSRTKITNNGLCRLKGLKQLKILILEDTKITDAGLEYLQEMTQLKNLCLGHTAVTSAGVGKLREKLPKVLIYIILREYYQGGDF
jgi:hypothetical protein